MLRASVEINPQHHDTVHPHKINPQHHDTVHPHKINLQLHDRVHPHKTNPQHHDTAHPHKFNRSFTTRSPQDQPAASRHGASLQDQPTVSRHGASPQTQYLAPAATFPGCYINQRPLYGTSGIRFYSMTITPSHITIEQNTAQLWKYSRSAEEVNLHWLNVPFPLYSFWCC